MTSTNKGFYEQCKDCLYKLEIPGKRYPCMNSHKAVRKSGGVKYERDFTKCGLYKKESEKESLLKNELLKGTILESSKKDIIYLHEKDKEILIRFKEDIGFDNYPEKFSLTYLKAFEVAKDQSTKKYRLRKKGIE